MPGWTREPAIGVRRPYAEVLSDPDGDRLASHSIRRVDLATAIGAGAPYSSSSFELWYVDLDLSGESLSRSRRWLSDDELARGERLCSELARSRYFAGRASLRCLLADRLGCAPDAIRFSYGRYGKPRIEGGWRNLEFSLAHSEGDAVIALARGGAAIGVDIELLRPIADVESLASLVFSDAERRELEIAPEPVSAFLNGWTRKEAYVKALGLGLTAPLKEITVSLSARPELVSTCVPGQSASDWRLLNVPHPRALVAVALGPRLDDGVRMP